MVSEDVRKQIEQVLSAGHPENAHVGMPISLLRELYRVMPVGLLVPPPVVA